MQVLYPAPSYSDLLSFASTSTADNTSYYAYHTFPTKAQYNPSLRWQHTAQTDIGLEMTVKGTRISISAFHHRTKNSYMSARTYTPFTYRYTGQAAIQQSGISADDRVFSIDQQTGTVTVSSAADPSMQKELSYTDRHTYTTNQYYTNASPLSRYGLEWMVDFAQFKALRTQLRIDGNFVPRTDIATFYYSLDGDNWQQLGGDYRLRFDWQRFFMGSKYALFNYATQKTGGYIDVDSFTIE